MPKNTHNIENKRVIDSEIYFNNKIHSPEADRYDNSNIKGNKIMPIISPIKRYLTPMNNQGEGENMECDGIKGIEKMEEDQKTIWLDLEKRLKEMEREEERKKMKMSINLKRVYSFHIY